MSPRRPKRRSWRPTIPDWSRWKPFRAATITTSPPTRSRRGAGRWRGSIRARRALCGAFSGLWPEKCPHNGLWPRRRPLPVRVVVLHHHEAALETEAAGKGPREGSQRLAIAVADQQLVLDAAALGLRLEAEPRAVRESDRVEPVELDRSRLRGRAVDPDRALAALGRVVDPVDEVPPDRAAVVQAADTGRPAPHGVARVVAGGFVLDAARFELPALAVHAHVAVDRYV